LKGLNIMAKLVYRFLSPFEISGQKEVGADIGGLDAWRLEISDSLSLATRAERSESLSP
jgi:hypothetical protein